MDWKTPLVLGIACFVLLPGTFFSIGKPRRGQTAAIHAALFGLVASVLQPLFDLPKEGFQTKGTCPYPPYDLYNYCVDSTGKNICTGTVHNLEHPDNMFYYAAVYQATPSKGTIIVNHNCSVTSYINTKGLMTDALVLDKDTKTYAQVIFVNGLPKETKPWNAGTTKLVTAAKIVFDTSKVYSGIVDLLVKKYDIDLKAAVAAAAAPSGAAAPGAATPPAPATAATATAAPATAAPAATVSVSVPNPSPPKETTTLGMSKQTLMIVGGVVGGLLLLGLILALTRK